MLMTYYYIAKYMPQGRQLFFTGSLNQGSKRRSESMELAIETNFVTTA